MSIYALIAEIIADALAILIILLFVKGVTEEFVWRIKERRVKKVSREDITKDTKDTKDPPKTIDDLMLILSQSNKKS